MKILIYLFLAIGALSILFSCTKRSQRLLSQEDQLIEAVLKAHGGKKYQSANYSFKFRGNEYSFKNDFAKYEYTKSYIVKGVRVIDKLSNEGFSRMVNGSPQELSESDQSRYGNALNSVIYFAQIPNKLQDPSVMKSSKGKTKIKGQNYEVVEVTFKKEGGGKDFDDVYYYWIHEDNKTVDYFGYNFHVNKGGVRFRSHYNRRNVDGIIFQDYINYSADKETPLSDLPKLFETGKLKELSRIELVDVKKEG